MPTQTVPSMQRQTKTNQSRGTSTGHLRREQTERHLFSAEPRRVRYVVDNKFILDGDAVENTTNEAQHSITQGLYDPNSDKLFDAKQLLLVDRHNAGEAQRGREQEGVQRAQQAELGMTFGHLFDNTEDEEKESDGEVEKYFR